MKFKDKVVIVTGASHGIGQRIAVRFKDEGAHVVTLDIQGQPDVSGDMGIQEDVERLADYVLTTYGHVDVIVNNAKPVFKGLKNCGWAMFGCALDVGVLGPYYLVHLLQGHLGEGASVINITSTRAHMSMPQSESYAAAKGGLEALTHALAMSLAGKARVNAIAPGWIDVNDEDLIEADNLQQAVGRVGNTDDIASLALYLAGDEAGFITGQSIAVDGGMSRQMIYHGEYGWSYDPEGDEN